MSDFRKVIQFGKSLAITLPSKSAEKLRIEAGGTLHVDLVNDRIVLSVVRPEDFLKLGTQEEEVEA